MTKCCSVVCDTASGILRCELELPEDATIADALVAARSRLGAQAADWERAAVGIFGCPRRRDYVPGAGDRIELYRALPADPRARRRARAGAARPERQ